MLIQRI